MERSHVYSNCRFRHNSLSSDPLTGNNSSTSEKIGRGSKMGNASKSTALIFNAPAPKKGEENASAEAATHPTAVLTNRLRFDDMDSMTCHSVTFGLLI